MRNAKATFLHRWYKEVWNESREATIGELLADDVIIHGLSEGKLRGANGFKIFYEGFRKQFENIHIVIEDVVSQDDTECALCTATATHIASGKAVKFGGLTMARIAGGKAVEAWNCFDFYNMYLQLGYELKSQ